MVWRIVLFISSLVWRISLWLLCTIAYEYNAVLSHTVTLANPKYTCLSSAFWTLYIQNKIHMIVKDKMIDTICWLTLNMIAWWRVKTLTSNGTKSKLVRVWNFNHKSYQIMTDCYLIHMVVSVILPNCIHWQQVRPN